MRAGTASVVVTIITLLLGLRSPVHAARCHIDDVGDAFEAAYETIKDVTTNPRCAPIVANPGFWILVGAFAAGTTSTPQLRDACNTIEDVANAAGTSRERAQSALNKLPAFVRKPLEDQFGGTVGAANETVSGVLLPLAWAACACHVANSAGISKTFDVAGECVKDSLCGLDAAIFGNSCAAAPQGISMVDCTKGVIGFGWRPVGGGLYVNSQGASIQNKEVGFACACPAPMKFATVYFPKPTDHPGCYGNGKLTTDGCRACVCPYPTKQVAMGVCICPDGSPMLPSGVCPSPCKGTCPPGQILKRSVRLSNGQCSSECACPPGQAMAGGKCEWPPCTAAGETRLPGGVCCAKDRVSACGTCCTGGQVPDAATGQCVATPVQKLQPAGEPPAAKPEENPKPILFLPREKAVRPFSPIKW